MNIPQQKAKPPTSVSQDRIKSNVGHIELFHDVEARIVQGIRLGQSTMIVENCTKDQFLTFFEENPNISKFLSFRHGSEIWISEFTESLVHSGVTILLATIARIHSATLGANSTVVHSNVNLVISDNCSRAADVSIRYRNRVVPGSNVHIEVAYSQTLSDVINWTEDILDDNPIAPGAVQNNVMYYLAIKIMYPIDIVNPGNFQAIAIAFQFIPNADIYMPVGIYSFGTIQGSAESAGRIVELVNALGGGLPGGAMRLDLATHASLFHGFTFSTDGPCNATTAADPAYHIVIPATAIVSMDRNVIDPAVGNPIPDIYNMDISLFEIQREIADNFGLMVKLNSNIPTQSTNAAEHGGGPLQLLTFQVEGVNVDDHLLR